ncbi:MAG TPA: hypothetical protein VGZ25_11150 [Gemmataceae bacterium]|jgi:hypothetical protein|nr:hypothetical protein [Gemmataceae bacterium]
MSIKDQVELKVSREKLNWLEKEYEAVKLRPSTNPAIQEWTLRSLKQTINQLKEEIVRFESHSENPTPTS